MRGDAVVVTAAGCEPLLFSPRIVKAGTMAFKEKVRKYWLTVSGDGDPDKASCEWRYYDEKKGFVKCGSQDHLEVHHLTTKDLTDAVKKLPSIRKGSDPKNILQLLISAVRSFHLENDPRFEFNLQEQGMEVSFCARIK